MKQSAKEQYAVIKMQIKDLEDQAKLLIPDIKAELEGTEDMKIKEEYGTFSIVKRMKYKYSEVVSDLEVQLKDIKKKEEEAGIAEATSVEDVRFTPSKFVVPKQFYKFD